MYAKPREVAGCICVLAELILSIFQRSSSRIWGLFGDYLGLFGDYSDGVVFVFTFYFYVAKCYTSLQQDFLDRDILSSSKYFLNRLGC